MELLSLAYADEHLHGDEAEVFHTLGADLGLTEDDLYAAQGWARKRATGAPEADLKAEAETLLAG